MSEMMSWHFRRRGRARVRQMLSMHATSLKVRTIGTKSNHGKERASEAQVEKRPVTLSEVCRNGISGNEEKQG